MLRQLPVHMLWISGELSRLARLGLASYLAHGYRVVLWTYGVAPGDAMGAEVRDATALVPRDGAERSEVAYLSSLFRYRVLAREGGLWSDMDVVALSTDQTPAAAPLLASEKRRPFRHREATATGDGLTQVTNCFMANPEPRNGDLWHRAASHVEALPPADRSWEKVGPHLLTSLLLSQSGPEVAILPPDTVDPVAWWNVPAYFLEEREPPPSPFMHMYASIWARRGVDADHPFPKNSLAGRLWSRYGL